MRECNGQQLDVSRINRVVAGGLGDYSVWRHALIVVEAEISAAAEGAFWERLFGRSKSN